MSKSTNKKDKANYLKSLFTQHGWQLALSTMLLFAFLGEQVEFAQAQTSPKPRKKYNNDNEFVPEQLKDPPDLQFLPPYPNAKYSNILAFKRLPKKPGFSLTFHAKEAPDEVINFYKEAFKSNRWLPQQGGDGPRSATGMRHGAIAVVNVMRPIVKGYKTQVYLVYKIYGEIK